MYRELVERKLFIRVKKREIIKKINELEMAGVDYTDLIFATIMEADINQLLKEKKKKLSLV